MTREKANSLARVEVVLREEAEEMEPGTWQEMLACWARVLDNALARYESQTGEAVSPADDREATVLTLLPGGTAAPEGRGC
jgi:hypothetical protein